MAEVIDLLANLTANRDRERVDVSFVQALMSLLQCERVAVYRLVGEADEWRWLLCARMDHGEIAPLSDPPWVDFHTLPLKGATPWREDCVTRQAMTLAPESADPPRQISAFPLTGDPTSATVVEFTTVNPLTTAELRTIQTLLRIYGNFQGLLDYSQRDTLTGLFNRKTFDDSFYKSVQQTVDAGQESSDAGRRHAHAQQHYLGVVDIDHFKHVNDQYGHLIGDEVLLLVARILRSTFRFQDRLYRFGGEEFVIMLRCDGEADALLAFERFRKNMESFTFPQVGRVTVSLGFTEVQPGDTPAAAFERADKAVYYAKQNGRNQVHSQAELVRIGALEDASKVGDVELF